MTCLDDDVVLGLVEGRLAAPVLAGVDEHLDACATCRDVVAQLARVAAPARVLERGHTVGRYVIGELLGAGAWGRVYSAWEPELDRRVAIKVLVAEGDGARDRVVREAQAMARLDHPNVVGVHEVGTSPDGVYVAMDLVEGQTLRAWAAGGRAWRDVVAALVDVARGLAAVHAAGVVHRDVKPDNVIVGIDGRARLGDFGLARSGPTAQPPRAGLLAEGTPATSVAGTPAYMAPEVLRGGAATPASDQFGFGVLAYEVLAGTRPFTGATWAALLARIEAGAPPALRDVPGWLADVVRRCLAVTPERRFASLAEVAERLATNAHRRSPARWIAGGVVVAALASATTWLAIRGETATAARCEVGGEELAATWNPRVRGRLAALGAPTLAALDRWAASWTQERDASCRAAETAPPAQLAARARCLEQRRDELAALLARVVSAPGTGGRLADALAALPPPSECRVAHADPVPLDPARASLVAEVAAGLPAIRAATALGDARPVLAEVARIVERARASAHAPTLAEALLVHAEALRGASRLADAHVAARDAVVAAERGHADLLAARAWIARVATAGDRRELVLAEDFGAIAAAAVERAGAPPHLAATLLKLRGLVAYNRRDLATATALLTEARTRFAELSGPRSLEVAAVESALGSVARVAEQLDEAERWHRSALAIDRALRGDSHPDVARDLHNVAGVLRLRGELDAAAATYGEALAIELATRGERSVEAGLTQNSIGLVHMARGDWTAARTFLERARDALTAADHGDRAFAHHNLGLVAAATGDHRAALAAYARAAEVYAATIGEAAPAAIRLVLDRARAERALAMPAATATAARARDLARTAGIAWIADEAAELAAQRTTRPRPPTAGVERRTEPPVGGERVTSPASAAEPPPPTPPSPPRKDVGVYGSTQPW